MPTVKLKTKASATLDQASFEAIVQNVPNYALFTTEPNGTILNWNHGAERLTEWAASEAISQNLDFIVLDNDAAALSAALKKATRTGYVQRNCTILTKRSLTLLATMTICSLQPHLNGFMVVIKDITQQHKVTTDQTDANDLLRGEIERRKEVEKALNISNADLESFASAASHDLQEPLRMVISYLQLIERRYKKLFDNDGRDFLEYAVDGAVRMRSLISDLVEYSRIGSISKPFKLVKTNEVLQQVIESLSLYAGDVGANITFDPLPDVVGDEVQLSQLFQNLIANAVKFGDRSHPTVHIGVKTKATHFVFAVTDNGAGIKKKDYEHIFLIFKQLGSRANRSGSGIGLAIAKKIVAHHDGKIWVDSTVGKGSTFYVSLPRYSDSGTTIESGHSR